MKVEPSWILAPEILSGTKMGGIRIVPISFQIALILPVNIALLLHHRNRGHHGGRVGCLGILMLHQILWTSSAPSDVPHLP